MSLCVVLWCLCICLSSDLFAQNCTPQPTLDCREAPVICSLDALNGFSCANPEQFNPAGPTPLCPSGGVPNNLSWWSFVGGGGVIEFEISVGNCTGSTTPGIQFGIYSDCNFTDPIACEVDCLSGTKTFSALTEACRTYYFFVDGCNNASCEYTIQVLSGVEPPAELEVPLLELVSNTCVGKEVCAFADAVGQCGDHFQWMLDGVIQQGDAATWCHEFIAQGEFELCVRSFLGNENDQCVLSKPVCQTLTVDGPATREKSREVACYEDRNGLFFTECVTPVPPIPGSYRICCQSVTPAGCQERLCKEYIVLPENHGPDQVRDYCENTIITLPDGRMVDQCGDFRILLPGASQYGCDSSYLLRINFTEPVIDFVEPVCEEDDYCISVVVDFPCMDRPVQYTHYWLSADGKDTLVRNNANICTDMPGEYCYLVEFRLDGNECISRKECLRIPSASWATWNGLPEYCKEETGRESVLYYGRQRPDRYVWSIQGGEIISSQDTVVTWKAFDTSKVVKVCVQGFVEDCQLLDTCVTRAIISSPDPGFHWVQDGNNLIFYSDDTGEGMSKWNINGTDYFGDTVTIPFYENQVVGVNHHRMNRCDSSEISGKAPFILSRSYAQKLPPVLDGISILPVTDPGVVSILLPEQKNLLIELIDLTGRLWYRNSVDSGTDRLRLDAPMPNLDGGGLFYVVVWDTTSGERTNRAVVVPR